MKNSSKNKFNLSTDQKVEIVFNILKWWESKQMGEREGDSLFDEIQFAEHNKENLDKHLSLEKEVVEIDKQIRDLQLNEMLTDQTLLSSGVIDKLKEKRKKLKKGRKIEKSLARPDPISIRNNTPKNKILIFLFHSMYFNCYHFDNQIGQYISDFFDPINTSPNQIDEFITKIGFKKKINSSLKSDYNFIDDKDLILESFSWYDNFPTKKDGEEFYYSSIFQATIKIIYNDFYDLLFAYYFIRIFIHQVKSKDLSNIEYNYSVPNEYPELLKGLIKRFQIEEIKSFSRGRVSRYRYDSRPLDLLATGLIDILIDSPKYKKVFSSSTKNYENLAFSNAKDFISLYNSEHKPKLQNSKIKQQFSSSIDYLIGRYIQGIEHSKIELNYNLHQRPLKELLSSSKRDLLIFHTKDFPQSPNNKRHSRLSIIENLDNLISNNIFIDIDKFLSTNGRAFILTSANIKLDQSEILNTWFDKRLIKTIIDFSRSQRRGPLRHSYYMIELTKKPNGNINFVFANDYADELDNIDFILKNRLRIKKFFKSKKNNLIEHASQEIYNIYRNRIVSYSSSKDFSDFLKKGIRFEVTLKDSIKLNKIIRPLILEVTDEVPNNIIEPDINNLNEIEDFKAENLCFEKNGDIKWSVKSSENMQIFKEDKFIKLIPNSIIAYNHNLRHGIPYIGYFNPSDKSKSYFIKHRTGFGSSVESYALIKEEILPEFLIVEMSKKYFRELLKINDSNSVIDRFLNTKIKTNLFKDQKNQIDSYYKVLSDIKSFKEKGRAFEKSNIHVINRLEHRLDPKIGNFKSHINRLIKDIDAGSTDKQKHLKYLNILLETVNSMESLIELSGKEIKNPDKIEIEKISINSLIEVIKNIDSNQYVFDIELEQFNSSKEEDLYAAHLDSSILDLKVEFYDNIEEFEKDNYKIPDQDKDDHYWEMAAKSETFGFLDEAQILSNKSMFTEMVDNILTNTNIHAFNEIRKENQVLKIGINLSREINDAEQPEYYFVLSFSNNGAKLPKGYEKKHFIQNGKESKKGTGSGGYYLNDIAISFENPDWEFITDSEEISDNFAPALTYKFKFKIYEG